MHLVFNIWVESLLCVSLRVSRHTFRFFQSQYTNSGIDVTLIFCILYRVNYTRWDLIFLLRRWEILIGKNVPQYSAGHECYISKYACPPDNFFPRLHLEIAQHIYTH